MIPETAYPEKARSMYDLIERLPKAVTRLEAALDGLSTAECEESPFAGKWSIHQCVEHIALVSLGWTDIFYQAIDGIYPTPCTMNPQWQAALEDDARQGMPEAVAVYRQHNTAVADFLTTLPASDFDRGFQIVSFLTEPFQINESVNWGLVIHCDYHLATLHKLRLQLGVPLAWMGVYLERYPKP